MCSIGLFCLFNIKFLHSYKNLHLPVCGATLRSPCQHSCAFIGFAIAQSFQELCKGGACICNVPFPVFRMPVSDLRLHTQPWIFGIFLPESTVMLRTVAFPAAPVGIVRTVAMLVGCRRHRPGGPRRTCSVAEAPRKQVLCTPAQTARSPRATQVPTSAQSSAW